MGPTTAQQQHASQQAILAGDAVLLLAEQQQHEQGGEWPDEDGAALPSAEQIRVAKERRERMRAALAAGGDDFIALDAVEAPSATTAAEAVESSDDGEKESRLVREKEDDSDEPFEEHRGATITFGAPTAPVDVSTSDRKVVDVDADFEMELIRQGAYDRGLELEASVLRDTQALRQRTNASQVVATAMAFRVRGLSVSLAALRKRVQHSEEQCALLATQLRSASAMAADATAELPALEASLKDASEKYDYMQRTRDYAFNLLECLGVCAPQVDALEAELRVFYMQRGIEARASAAEPHWEGPANVVPAWANGTERAALEAKAALVFDNVVDEYASCRLIAGHFEVFKRKYADAYRGAYVGDSLVDVFAPFARWELLGWDGFLRPDSTAALQQRWFQVAVSLFGDYSEEVFLALVSKVLVPKVEALLQDAYDVSSRPQTVRAIEQVEQLVSLYESNPAALRTLLDAVVTTVTASLNINGNGGGASGLWAAIRKVDNALLWAASLPAPQGPALGSALFVFLGHVLGHAVRAADAELRTAILSSGAAEMFRRQGLVME